MIEKKLSDWAKENGIKYKNAWHGAKEGTLPVKTRITPNGRIFAILDDPKVEIKSKTDFAIPMLAGKETSTASVRRNAAATSSPTNEYHHIKNGISPFSASTSRRNAGESNAGIFPVSEAIHLCQKAYYNFSIFRNTIDAMTEFSASKIFYQGGTSKSRNFFQNLFESLNIYNFQDKFFREYYRSGNVFIYRFEVSPKEEDLNRLNKIYNSDAKGIKLPSKYIIVNPYDIGVQSNIVFGSNVIFFKRLNGYEIHRLRNKETPEEKAFFDSLPADSQKQIMSGAGTVIVPLNPERLYAVFYKTQDYEPMAIPMGYPVLKDIEWKAEMKHIDMAISRTMNNVVLLVKMGYQTKEGDYMFDPKAAEAMRQLFESESVGKTLVADFTTEVSFIIPQIGDFLDPKKYEIVNEDIKTGLNYVLTGTDSKFANQFISVQLFVQRLQQAREIFLTQFLIPEIKRISELMGFKSYPIPKFEDINLKDDIEFNRVVTRMAELGLLTAPELFDAIETGRIPTAEESLENQTSYRELKDKGFYDPLIGGPYDAQKLAKITAASRTPPGVSTQKSIPTPTGRPTNINTKQSTKKVGITKGSEIFNESYSLTKVKDNLILASQLREEIQSFFSKHKKIKSFNEEQLNIINEISEIIIANENCDKWKDKDIIEKYIKNPINTNMERLKEIDIISYEHGISPSLGAILFSSKVNDK